MLNLGKEITQLTVDVKTYIREMGVKHTWKTWCDIPKGRIYLLNGVRIRKINDELVTYRAKDDEGNSVKIYFKVWNDCDAVELSIKRIRGSMIPV